MIKNNYYDGKLSINARKQSIKSDIIFTYLCKEKEKSRLHFYIHKDLIIHNITCGGLDKYEVEEDIANWSPFISESKKITIYFKEPLLKGEKVDISFNYSGQIRKIEGSGVNRITEKWVELGIYAPWFPLLESFDKAWFKVKVSFEEGKYVVVGSNNIKEVGDGWLIDQKVPFIDCSFLASEYFVDNQYGSQVSQIDCKVYYIDEKHKSIAKTLSDQSLWILDSFINKFGDINHQDYSIVIVPREDGGGYNRPGLVVLPDLSEDQSVTHYKYLSGDIGNFKYLAHEIAHLWWSKADMTTWEDWLNESFAEYSCLIAIRNYYGEKEFKGIIEKYIEGSKTLPPIKGIDRGHENAFDVLYIKGPVLLYELEREIGKKVFEKLLNEIHTNKISNIEKLIDKLSELTHRETVENFIKKLNS